MSKAIIITIISKNIVQKQYVENHQRIHTWLTNQKHFRNALHSTPT